MVRENNLLERIGLMNEDRAKELLAEMLYSYSAIGTVGHDKEKFIRDVKTIYLRLLLDRNES